jgi:flagellin
MALSIVSNQAASIASRQLGQTNDAATATAEKLSSGKRVNSAKDDAAASAIAARLSAEVAGLQQASVNAGQGSSLLQIADGASQNVEDILTRAKSLAVQAGSEQISDTERQFLDQEFQALKSEIDRIASDTEFNGTKLVNGDIKESGAATGAFQGVVAQGVTFDGSTTNMDLVVMASNVNNGNLTTAGATATGDLMLAYDSIVTQNGLDANFRTTITGVTFRVSDGGANVTLAAPITATLKPQDSVNGTPGMGSIMVQIGRTDISTAALTSGGGTVASLTNMLTLQGQGTMDFTFKVGTGTLAGQDEISVSIRGISTNALGLDGVDIQNKGNADSASSAVSAAIDSLQAARSDIGAAQNRLDFAAQNVELTRENQEAARSELEDLNVAKAITEFSQQQLLVQAGTSTLSQANRLPQNLLQLFQ